MRANNYAKTSPAPGRHAKDRQRRLLVAGQGKLANDELLHRIFNQREMTVASRTKGLRDALKRLESGGIDMVLLNCECREEELELFALAAQKRGFAGPILRVVRSTGKTPAASLQGGDSSSAYFDQRRAATPETQPSGESDATHGSIALTQKERTVLMRVLEGWTSGQIARSLKRSEGSVKSSLQQIFKKLGVRKRSLVVRMAWEGNIAGVPQRHPFASQASPSPAALLAKQASSAQSASQPIHAGDFVVDVHMRRAWVRGVEMQFSPNEFELLRCFSEHPDQLLRYESLLEMLWGNPAAARESLRVLIRALRTKVETTKTPRYIVTQRNFGYRFIPSHAS
jgi:DNA-binding CsgD family transcriptional regulator/DNA-binding winged helix-turn-helix (wHTH) protein